MKQMITEFLSTELLSIRHLKAPSNIHPKTPMKNKENLNNSDENDKPFNGLAILQSFTVFCELENHIK